MSHFYSQPQSYGNDAPNLQFYSAVPSTSAQPGSGSAAGGASSSAAATSSSSSSYYQGRPSLDPHAHGRPDIVAGAIGSSSSGPASRGGTASYTGPIIVANWWNAFTPWTGTEGEPPLLEELGVNFDHILQKSLTVLNPLKTVDSHIMDDADLAGPLVFCSVFASFLLLSGKPQFSYIYGVALVGSASIYALLNLMSERGIDAYRTASVLGYCLLPLVLLSMFSVVASLDGTLGYIASFITIIWCSFSASSIFSSVLHLSSQRLLVAYPVGLVYAAFAMLSVFDGRSGTVSIKG